MNTLKHIKTGRFVYYFIWIFLYILFLIPIAFFAINMFGSNGTGTVSDAWILVALVVLYECCRFITRVISQTIIYLAYPKTWLEIMDTEKFREFKKSWNDREDILNNLNQ